VLQRDQRPDTLAKGLTVIDRNLKRQAQMIEQLLDMSRIVSGKMRLDIARVRFGAVIDEAVHSVQSAADLKGVRLDVATGTPLDVRADPSRLQQIVWNLLLNAVKFSRTGDTVEVVLRQEHGEAVLEVRDVGQGIAPGSCPCCSTFRQGDASSTAGMPGLGLGLAIVKNLVEMHGGVVLATSDGLEKGATFTVRLPLAPQGAGEVKVVGNGHGPASSHADSTSHVLDGLVVLVVDDEPDARELLQHFLESAGARTTLAASVDDALQTLATGDRPDIIVSDIGLPDRDGYEFIRQVRRLRGAVADVPAAAVTAVAQRRRRRALMAGYQTHLASRSMRTSWWPWWRPWPAAPARRQQPWVRSARAMTVLGLLNETFNKWWADRIPRWPPRWPITRCSRCAPLLLVAIGIAGLVLGRDEARAQILVQASSLLGAPGAVAVARLMGDAYRHRDGDDQRGDRHRRHCDWRRGRAGAVEVGARRGMGRGAAPMSWLAFFRGY
jgi:CheY-like chemotaxis protein/two-component sensor histidine kinase